MILKLDLVDLSWIYGIKMCRHRELAFSPGEVRFVDASSIPAYKQPASAVYKCFNPPNCT